MGHTHGAHGCGCQGQPVFTGLSSAYRRTLWAVIALNAILFFTELTMGHIARSQALQADALDFLADTLTYSLSLAAISWPARRRTSVAVLKGTSLLLMGVYVFASTLYAVVVAQVPQAPIMLGTALLALGANVLSVLLLVRYKDGDANVRSVWLCSRNDAIGNIIVVAAALGVWGTATPWPDLLTATLMSGLFLHSAISILRQSLAEFRTSSPQP